MHVELYTCFPRLFILNYRYDICLDFLRSSSSATSKCLLKAFFLNMPDILLVLRAIHLFHMFARAEHEARFLQEKMLQRLHLSQTLYVRHVLCTYRTELKLVGIRKKKKKSVLVVSSELLSFVN